MVMGVSSEAVAGVGVADRHGEKTEAKSEQNDIEHGVLPSNVSERTFK
jgi:hypothetical protein